MIEQTLYLAVIIFIMGMGIQFFRVKQEDNFLNTVKNRLTRLSFKNFFLNTFLQAKLFKAGKVRWSIHLILVLSILYLLFVHGLHARTADLFFSDYQSTLDPFQFLRNVFGFLVLAGCLAFLVRRTLNLRVNQDARIKTKGLVTVLAIAFLIGSGFLLEASKIISEPIFMEMVEEYSDLDSEELIDLKLYWKDNYFVFFNARIKATPERLEHGQDVNEIYCLDCHSPIKSAVLSKILAKIIYDTGLWFNSNRMDRVVYWIHYTTCLIILICFPFSRLFHLFLIPFTAGQQNLTAQNYQEGMVSINAATLYACTNCGYCSQVCSVYPNFQIHRNPDVLPHTKIESVKIFLNNAYSMNKWQLYSGNSACTLCHNCTDICPSGIDLQSLWVVLDKKLVEMGMKDKNDFFNETPLNEWITQEYISDQEPNQDSTHRNSTNTNSTNTNSTNTNSTNTNSTNTNSTNTNSTKTNSTEEASINKVQTNKTFTQEAPIVGLTSNLVDRTESFENCIQCTICTNVCPIVDYDSDLNDMTPHQVMNLLRLGKKHSATGTRMVWTCLTCYACQENCPAQIRVTDIILELRNSGGVKADMIQRNQCIQSIHMNKADK